MALRRFPDGFLWGAATAAHQVEGANVNSDWWAFEHDSGTPCVEPSSDACDSWHRWPEDVDLVASLGLGAYRFSVEWSRIEPEEGEWSTSSLDHYRAMCARCRELGLVPIVTLNHFSIPLWLSRRGGWEAQEAVALFGRFCERVGSALGDLIGWACTINEPNVVSLMGYEWGIFPPAVRDHGRRLAVNGVLCRAHLEAVDALRSGPGDFPVGLTVSMTDHQVGIPDSRQTGGGAADEALEVFRRDMEDVFLEAARGDDFVGVQTYTRVRFGPEGPLGPQPGVALTQVGYEYWPPALGATVKRAYEMTGVPVLVSENGIATSDDTQRIAFIEEALASLMDAMADGVDVRGYIHWSLLDNFEWVLGYGPTFGLVSVDRATFDRSPKPSAAWFAKVARNNGL